jgi:hypothetical protein
MVIALCIIVVVLVALLSFSVAFNVHFIRNMLELDDAIDRALDVCDVTYGRASRLLELPITMNTPEVRMIVSEIKNIRNSVLIISNIIAEPTDRIEESDD